MVPILTILGFDFEVSMVEAGVDVEFVEIVGEHNRVTLPNTESVKSVLLNKIGTAKLLISIHKKHEIITPVDEGILTECAIRGYQRS